MPSRATKNVTPEPSVDSSTDATAEPEPEEEVRTTPASLTPIRSAVPQRQLILDDNDRMTIHGLITAALGAQGLTVSPAEFDYFMRVCELRGVNPLFREAYLIKEGDGRITVQIGIDGFRKLAEDTGEYAGQTDADWDDETYEGPIVAWQGKPAHVKVGVFRSGWDRPLYGECWLDEDGVVSRDGKPVGQWGQRTRTMMRKVAEARALRAAFPRSLAGLYTDDEMRVVGDGPGRDVDQLASGSPDGTGATESGAASTNGGWRPPEAPPAPEGLQGVVQQDADGVRRTKPNSEIGRRHGFDGNRTADKLELVIKAKGKKHTAMLFDDIAQRTDVLQIKANEVVVLTGGVVEEHEWQEGKPPQKQVWEVKTVAVLRGDHWLTTDEAAPSLPLAEPSSATSPDPSVASAPTPTTPEASSSAAATPSPAPTASPASSASGEPGPTTPTSSVSSTTSEPSTSSTPAPAATTSPPGATTSDLPPLDRTDGTILTGLPVVLSSDIEFKTAAGRLVGVLRCTYGAEVVRCALGDEPAGEVQAQLGTELAPTYEPGDRIIVVGTWNNDWVVVTAIGRHGA